MSGACLEYAKPARRLPVLLPHHRHTFLTVYTAKGLWTTHSLRSQRSLTAPSGLPPASTSMRCASTARSTTFPPKRYDLIKYPSDGAAVPNITNVHRRSSPLAAVVGKAATRDMEAETTAKVMTSSYNQRYWPDT